MNAQHTQGPWRYIPELYAVVTDSGRRNVAGSVGAAGDTLAQRDAIGKLIAATPDLLAMLRETLRALEAFDVAKGVQQDAHAAIAKATGAQQ